LARILFVASRKLRRFPCEIRINAAEARRVPSRNPPRPLDNPLLQFWLDRRAAWITTVSQAACASVFLPGAYQSRREWSFPIR